MAGIVTITYRTSTETLYQEFFFTRGKLKRHPLTKTLAPEFETFRAELDAARAEEIGIIAAQYETSAAVDFVDEDLDALVDVISSSLVNGSPQGRSSTEYLRYFGSQRPSDLKRPVLSTQLDTMRTWPPSLKGSSSTTLQGYGHKLEGLVTVADECQKEHTSAEQSYTDFRTVGTRRKLVDKLNALRSTIRGKLGKIQHEHPELGAGWADAFFRQGTSDERVTVKQLDRRIAATHAELSALKKQRDELAGREEEAAKAKAQRERDQKLAAIAAAKKAAAELSAQAAELEASLGEAPDGAPDP